MEYTFEIDNQTITHSFSSEEYEKIKKLAVSISVEFARTRLRTTTSRMEKKIPIKKIDGLRVDVDVLDDDDRYMFRIFAYGSIPPFGTSGGFIYRIESKKLDDLIKVIAVLKYCCDNLRYDIFNNKFTLSSSQVTNFLSLSGDLFACENVVLDFDNCSVCHNPTLRETQCNHYLCIRCFQQLQREKCPICRKSLWEEEEYSEEEED